MSENDKTSPHPGPDGAPEPRQPENGQHLLTTRSALVLLVSLAIGIVVGLLTCAAGRSAAEGTLAGMAAAATALPLLNSLVGP